MIPCQIVLVRTRNSSDVVGQSLDLGVIVGFHIQRDADDSRTGHASSLLSTVLERRLDATVANRRLMARTGLGFARRSQLAIPNDLHALGGVGHSARENGAMAMASASPGRVAQRAGFAAAVIAACLVGFVGMRAMLPSADAPFDDAIGYSAIDQTRAEDWAPSLPAVSAGGHVYRVTAADRDDAVVFGAGCGTDRDGFVFTESGEPSDLYHGTRLSDHWFYLSQCRSGGI